MKKTYCDKCGKEVDEHFVFIYKIERPQIIGKLCGSEKKLDLCTECIKTLSSFIENRFE